MTKIIETDTYRIPGIYEPIEYVVKTYTICDKCGSADIRNKSNAHLPASIIGGFSLVIVVSFIGGIVLAFGKMLMGFIGVWIISLVTFIAFGCLTGYVELNNNKNPKCNACGNEHIT